MIKVGPAGSAGLGNLKGVLKVAAMGLDCMEVAFTYGVRMGLAGAAEVGALAREKRVTLSVHAPYYINLASHETDKFDASCRRILDSCERAHALGARNVAFHAGFYQKRTAGQTYRQIKKALTGLQKEIARRGWQVRLCPEITGKPSQFGSLEELLKLMAGIKCGITVDFSPLYARRQGDVDYPGVLAKLPQKFHAHFSGIEYGPKGERRHIRTTPEFFEPLARALIRHQADVTLICESPRPYEDAFMMKQLVAYLQKEINP